MLSTCVQRMTLLVITLLFAACDGNGNEAQRLLQGQAEQFSYQGRIDFSDEKRPVIIWQGSTIQFETDAQHLELGFADVNGQVFFDLVAGEHQQVLEAKDGWHQVTLPATEQTRSITLFKRSEAAAGTAAFLGVKIPAKASVAAQTEPSSALKLMFYGDSITVGACNEDGEQDQWQTARTHNTAKSYGVFVARALGAQYRSIAVSGVGIVTGYKPYTAAQIWDKYYPTAESAIADITWQPDWLFINYGENDDSFTRNNDQPFPSEFTERYVQLVRSMRKAYPQSHIVILRGGMYGGAMSDRLIEPWWQVVNQLQAEDSNIHHYVFKHWSTLHPRVSDHKQMAAELLRWLQVQTGSHINNP